MVRLVSEFTECLWCHTDIRRTPLVFVDLTLINCPRCGCYTVDFTLLGDETIDLFAVTDAQRPLIAGYIHEQTRRGQVPKVTSRIVEQLLRT